MTRKIHLLNLHLSFSGYCFWYSCCIISCIFPDLTQGICLCNLETYFHCLHYRISLHSYFQARHLLFMKIEWFKFGASWSWGSASHPYPLELFEAKIECNCSLAFLQIINCRHNPKYARTRGTAQCKIHKLFLNFLIL